MPALIAGRRPRGRGDLPRASRREARSGAVSLRGTAVLAQTEAVDGTVTRYTLTRAVTRSRQLTRARGRASGTGRRRPAPGARGSRAGGRSSTRSYRARRGRG